jgi:acyl-coenzyme A thioesterase PaaI-like protein
MKKLSNPFINQKGYDCFVCSPNNPVGLHLDFYLDGDIVKTNWQPADVYQGYPNILHGGIQATLLDEIASWAVYVIAGTGGVTSRMEVRYKKPVLINKGKIYLTGKIIEQKQKIITVCSRLYNNAGDLCTDGTVFYYVFSPEVAKAKMDYPGQEAFLKKS